MDAFTSITVTQGASETIYARSAMVRDKDKIAVTHYVNGQRTGTMLVSKETALQQLERILSAE